jgi:nucleoside-diphosphate-sugar epimerase
MIIAITGARGFWGRYLVNFLQKQGLTVIPMDRQNCDLSIQSEVSSFFQTHPIDVLVHLASKVSPGRGGYQFHQQFNETVLSVSHICQSVPTAIKRLVLVGSIEEYGANIAPFHEGMSPSSISTYGWGKIASFYAAQTILRERKLEYCWVRPGLMYGSGIGENLFFGRVLHGCLRGESIDLTLGMQTRDFCYIKDASDQLKNIILYSGQWNGEIINIGSGVPRQLREVALALQKKIGKGQLNFGKIPYRNGEVMDFYLCMKKYESYFGQLHLTEFNHSLDLLIDELSISMSDYEST